MTSSTPPRGAQSPDDSPGSPWRHRHDRAATRGKWTACRLRAAIHLGTGFAVMVTGILAGMAVAAQDAAPQYNSQTAKDHVGQAAIVCGQVIRSSCTQTIPDGDVILTLAPADDPNPFTIRIPSARREVMGRGWPSRYDLNVVCTMGVIRPAGAGFEIVAAEPAALTAPTELNRDLPRFSLDAYGACDPDTKLPVLVKEVKPSYTADALSRRISGRVLLRAVVKEDGTVGDLRIERSLDRDLDISAARAAKQWTFRPGTFRGQAVPTVVTIEMSFVVGRR